MSTASELEDIQEKAMRRAMSRQYYCVYCSRNKQEECESLRRYPSSDCRQIKIAKFEKYTGLFLLVWSLFGFLAFFGIGV